MKSINRCYFGVFSTVLLFLPVVLAAQTKHTFVLDKPYEVQKIVSPAGNKVKNVILMIGDGMSLMHMYSAWTANKGSLYIDNFPVTGLSKTYCANRLITDSGAGGTAIATGLKTNYHSVGVDTSGLPLSSIVKLATKKGMATGVAVTCRLWDATPASFCCDNIERDSVEEIAGDYVNCGADYVFGGGANLFENRKDKRNIFTELKGKGYQLPRSWEELKKIKSGKVVAVVDSVDTPVPAVRGDLLAKASLKGIELLSANKNGFFMMIEGSQIDDYGHSHQLDLLMEEILDFDRTIGQVLKWAEKDGETLVIVTSDHETGGLTLLDGDIATGKIVCNFSTTSHSGVMVPVFAFGPGAINFTGLYENTAIFAKIKKLLKL